MTDEDGTPWLDYVIIDLKQDKNLKRSHTGNSWFSLMTLSVRESLLLKVTTPIGGIEQTVHSKGVPRNDSLKVIYKKEELMRKSVLKWQKRTMRSIVSIWNTCSKSDSPCTEDQHCCITCVYVRILCCKQPTSHWNYWTPRYSPSLPDGQPSSWCLNKYGHGNQQSADHGGTT